MAASRALHQLLVDGGRHDAATVARRMNVPRSTLYAKAEGKVPVCSERR